MKKMRISAILLFIIFIPSLSGCTLTAGKEQVYFYERPAIGFTVRDEVTTDVELKKNSINLTAGDGIIRVTSYEGDKLQVIEKRKLTGPASRKTLKTMLEENKLNVEPDSIEVKLNENPEKKQKPLFSLVIDIELKVPKAVKKIDIVSKSGEIIISGLKEKDSLNLNVEKGNIKVDDCKAYKIFTSITNGDLDIGNSEGIGSYKCDKGNITMQNLKGDIELKSMSGDSVIENVEGKLVCDISTGSLTVGKSSIRKDSDLYISNGDIKMDLENLDNEGKYTIKASTGNINLNIAETAGWSLLAKSTKGSVRNNLMLEKGVLKTSPSGEVYGDVRGGGPLIDVYVDRGNIILH